MRAAEGAAHDYSASADRPGSVPFTSAPLVLREFEKGEHQLRWLVQQETALEETLLCVSGALRVLEELLSAD